MTPADAGALRAKATGSSDSPTALSGRKRAGIELSAENGRYRTDNPPATSYRGGSRVAGQLSPGEPLRRPALLVTVARIAPPITWHVRLRYSLSARQRSRTALSRRQRDLVLHTYPRGTPYLPEGPAAISAGPPS